MGEGLAAAGSVFKITYHKTPSPSRDSPLDQLPNFLRTFNLSDITHMCLGGISFKPVFLQSILYSLENLEYLRVVHRGNWDEDPPLSGSSLFRPYLTALIPRDLDTETGDDFSDSETETETETETSQVQSSRFPCPSLRTLEALFLDRSAHLPLAVKLDEAYVRALVRCSKIRRQAGHPFKYCCVRKQFTRRFVSEGYMRRSLRLGDFEVLIGYIFYFLPFISP